MAVVPDGPGIMPAAFIGHGSPMNAIEMNRYTRAWRAFGEAVPRPRAVLCVSAHWYINTTAVTVMPRPRTIHDFFGFPPVLFDVEYPAPGLPELAEEIRDVVKPNWIGEDRDAWGLDHGTWSVLVHMFPDASVPVVQLSIDADKHFDDHFELGRRLSPLRERGVLVIGSGNVVHNLRAVNWSLEDTGYDWARRFNEHAMAHLLADPADVLDLPAHPDYPVAAPTPDHFIPLLHFSGLASAASDPVDVLVDGYTYGSISMAAYTLGFNGPKETGEGEAPSPPPQMAADGSDI